MIPQKKEEQEPQPAWLERAIKMYGESNFKDGDTISHLWLKHALDVPEPRTLMEADSVQWTLLTRVDAFKEWLLTERKTALQNVRGEGYRIIPPSEQAYIASQEAMRLVKKGLNKGNKLMTHVRLGDLDSEQKKRHTDAHIRLSGIGEMMTRQRKDIFKLFGPN